MCYAFHHTNLIRLVWSMLKDAVWKNKKSPRISESVGDLICPEINNINWTMVSNMLLGYKILFFQQNFKNLL